MPRFIEIPANGFSATNLASIAAAKTCEQRPTILAAWDGDNATAKSRENVLASNAVISANVEVGQRWAT
jgi:hypothetical protein